ncbi:MAG: cytochrome c biogenesis protein CcsA [Luteibaculaceae bacterium]
MDITYTGEHLLPGIIGNWLVVLALTAALFSAVSYFIKTSYPQSDAIWTNTGRWLFYLHSLSVIGITAVLFYLLLTHRFEYDYVWKHSNTEMPLKYIFSCFWEGQEGSFLLWIFWHALIGWFVIKYSGKWEAPVMVVFGITQVFLVSMILGSYIGDYKLGSSPFVLIRELPENLGMPWTLMPNYLQVIPEFADGRGLNPLLQNPWMTIHPPTLFAGFALSLIPFAFAIAGLWTKDYRGWIAPCLGWIYLAITILGIGILMGGAWAYEALSFGGFWAWDPVENAVLVPWLTLVGAAHLMLINRNRERSLYSMFFFVFISWILILYSTFLVRSGVLGDTSVHSFTGSGMTEQLLIYMLFFVALSAYMLILKNPDKGIYAGISFVLLIVGLSAPSNLGVPMVVLFIAVTAYFMFRGYKKHFPKQPDEENLLSREFWLFLGAIILLLASIQITFSTSIPVFNVILEPFATVFEKMYDLTGSTKFLELAQANFAPPIDPISHYNKWQIPFGFLTLLMIATGQFLAYGKTASKKFFKSISLSAALSLAATIVVGYFAGFELKEININLLLFSGFFALFANIDYFTRVLKGKIRLGGSSISHAGFALVILGALISAGKSEEISLNTSGIDVAQLGENFKNDEDILLFKGDTLALGPYFAVYKDKFKEGINLFYEIDFMEAKPAFYKKGELVFKSGIVFVCAEDHYATSSFLADQPKYWRMLENPNRLEMMSAKVWNASMAGDFLFALKPRIQLNPRFGNVPEPDTKHYLHKDIYTHIKWAELEDPDTDDEGYKNAILHKIAPGDTVYASQFMIIAEALVPVLDKEAHDLLSNDIAAKLKLRVESLAKDVYRAEPLFILRDSTLVVPDQVVLDNPGLKFQIETIDPETGKVSLFVAEHIRNNREFIVMQAIKFPFINILWLGCFVMLFGGILAVVQRHKKNKQLIERA